MSLKHLCVLAVIAVLLFVGCQSQRVSDDTAATPELREDGDRDDSSPDGSSSQSDLATSDYQLVERLENGGEKVEYLLMDGESNPVDLPTDVSEALRHSLPVLFGQGRYVIYDRAISEDGYILDLMVYDLYEQRRIHLDRFHVGGSGFLSFGQVSPDQRHILVVTGTWGEHSRERAEAIVYTIEDGEFVARREKSYVRPRLRCADECLVQEAGFRDNETIYYRQRAGGSEPVEEEQDLVEISFEELSFAPIDPEEPLSVICRGRKPCEEMSRFELTGPNTAGMEVIEIALHDLGEEGRRRHEPCAPFEHWLVDRDGASSVLLETCNDGYGMGRGIDQESIEGDHLIHTRSGGSNWMWTTRTMIDLSVPRVVEEYRRGAFSMDINTENMFWNWDALAGFVHWKAPICNEDPVHQPDLDLHDLANTEGPTFRYDLLPEIALPDAFSQEAWKSTSLGDCAIEVNAKEHTNDISGQGFVIHGEPADGDEARFQVVMGSPTELYVEITDPTWNFDDDSWLNQDHLEIWVGEPTSYRSSCIDSGPAAQWGISLEDGTVFSAHGSPEEEALQAEVAHQAGDDLEKIRVRIEFTDAPEALSIVYSDSFTGERQDRMIATSDLQHGESATLGKPKAIGVEQGHCFINDQGELEFEDRRRLEGAHIGLPR